MFRRLAQNEPFCVFHDSISSGGTAGLQPLRGNMPTVYVQLPLSAFSSLAVLSRALGADLWTIPFDHATLISLEAIWLLQRATELAHFETPYFAWLGPTPAGQQRLPLPTDPAILSPPAAAAERAPAAPAGDDGGESGQSAASAGRSGASLSPAGDGEPAALLHVITPLPLPTDRLLLVISPVREQHAMSMLAPQALIPTEAFGEALYGCLIDAKNSTGSSSSAEVEACMSAPRVWELVRDAQPALVEVVRAAAAASGSSGPAPRRLHY